MNATTNTEKRKNVKSATNVRTLVQIAMLAAVATVLMLVEFPLPFIAPPFYEMDFSEVPVLVGAFAMGPLAGAIIELIKILLNFVLNGTVTAGKLPDWMCDGSSGRYHLQKIQDKKKCNHWYGCGCDLYGCCRMRSERSRTSSGIRKSIWNADRSFRGNGFCYFPGNQ